MTTKRELKRTVDRLLADRAELVSTVIRVCDSRKETEQRSAALWELAKKQARVHREWQDFRMSTLTTEDAPEPKLRAFKDADGFPNRAWYEVAPDAFRYASSREQAEELVRYVPDSASNLEDLGRLWGPLTEVTE